MPESPPTVNHKIQSRPTLATVPAVGLGVPRVRPKYHPAMGLFFKELRESRDWSQRQAAAIAERRGLTELSRQILFRLERGQIKNPEPEVLRDVAALYDLSYADVVERFISARYGRDLIRPSGTDDGRRNAGTVERVLEDGTPPHVSTASHPQGSAHDVPSSRSFSEHAISELIQAAYAFRALSAQTGEWSQRLSILAADLGYDLSRQQTAMARPTTSTDAGRHRTHDRRVDGEGRDPRKTA
jgi:transcriptional regulator with XRE-family HTH domain